MSAARKAPNAIADPIGFARQHSVAKARKMQARRDNIARQRDASRNDTRLMHFRLDSGSAGGS